MAAPRPPQGGTGRLLDLLELQRLAGNRGVVRALEHSGRISQGDGGSHQGDSDSGPAAPVVQRRVLAPAEEIAAVAADRGLFDSLTVRVLQTITGMPAAGRNGVIGATTVRATSNWQTARGLGDNGIVDQPTMDRLVVESLANNRPEHGIQLVLDFYNLATGRDVLAVRHNAGALTFEGIRLIGGLLPLPEFSPASTQFESGGLRVI